MDTELLTGVEIPFVRTKDIPLPVHGTESDAESDGDGEVRKISASSFEARTVTVGARMRIWPSSWYWLYNSVSKHRVIFDAWSIAISAHCQQYHL